MVIKLFSSNFNNLKEGINELKDNISPMGNLIIQFSMMNNNEARHNMVNLRNDMEQTIYRYENLIRNNNVEPFYLDMRATNDIVIRPKKILQTNSENRGQTTGG